jgi:hypothetical protein
LIDAVHLESDEGRWILVLEDDFGTHSFQVDPEMVELALQPWREHVLEGEIIRLERERAGRPSWAQYIGDAPRVHYECPDPEGDWAEMVREQADALRKRNREGAMVDPGDESEAA